MAKPKPILITRETQTDPIILVDKSTMTDEVWHAPLSAPLQTLIDMAELIQTQKKLLVQEIDQLRKNKHELEEELNAKRQRRIVEDLYTIKRGQTLDDLSLSFD